MPACMPACILTIAIAGTNRSYPGAVDAGNFADSLLTIVEQTGEEYIFDVIESGFITGMRAIVEADLWRWT